jgi:uncharacterized protein involved in exopolysaccharide biosynthesis
MDLREVRAATERLLREYGGTKRRIAGLEEQIGELRARKEAQYDKLLMVKPREVRVSGGPLSDPVVDVVAEIVDVYEKRIKRIAGELREAMDKLAGIEDVVRRAALTETEQLYVRLRYFEGLPAWKVAQRMGYSKEGAFKHKCGAMRKIGERIALS